MTSTIAQGQILNLTIRSGSKLSVREHQSNLALTSEKELRETWGGLTYFEPIKHPPEPAKDHERLKRILQNKRKQLPSGARGIILFDVSELFMLSEFSIERALYGDTLVEFPRVDSPGQAVGQENWRRSRNGFLLQTSRVSAVVFQRREIKDGSSKIARQVYPTNRADADTIRLNLAELKRLLAPV